MKMQRVLMSSWRLVIQETRSPDGKRFAITNSSELPARYLGYHAPSIYLHLFPYSTTENLSGCKLQHLRLLYTQYPGPTTHASSYLVCVCVRVTACLCVHVCVCLYVLVIHHSLSVTDNRCTTDECFP